VYILNKCHAIVKTNIKGPLLCPENLEDLTAFQILLKGVNPPLLFFGRKPFG